MEHDESNTLFMLAAELLSPLALERFALGHSLFHREVSIAIFRLRDSD